MQEGDSICPYTGLRPFTEEESLYFKGREEHIAAVTLQLEEKKFLMVTGASGDGKSSLIFAGLIPQARAGFFKTQYSNWHVADFRPERSPLKNMAHSLANALQMEDANTIEVELSRGFSSLAELYKSSIRFVDEKSGVWKSASQEERSKMDRQSGNLLILIDQFEEFFTNPENFPGGVPSQESRLLLNIILETVKISLKENLPIYVVCTMRSDYIGQCAAFRGLPEFIGFSQFFVPRLQRKELHQVIEEPAILSGNRISKRLIDRLISDLDDGADQLPILQHALKQIWKAASDGREEMDLIHYAMVGGLAEDKLPDEDVDRFKTWKAGLPEFERVNLIHAGLSNVLDIHANALYEEAVAYHNNHSKTTITVKQAKFIIAMSFACLTRIDESRAVRNRMTLQEITNIIHVPEFTVDVVAGVLHIFRSSENTLVRPFTDSGESIHAETVIDITHEALIRNWKLLRKWSDQEYEYYVTFLDFQKQADRWIEHGKSEDFLLPIGPLTYFENWYKSCRPNQYWINRYNNNEEVESELKLKTSSAVLKNGRDYLRKSALRLLVTRSFMKYGAGRIGLVAGLVVLLLASAFFVNQWRIRANQHVLDKIVEESEILLAAKEPDLFIQAFITVDMERMLPGFFKKVMTTLPEQRKIDVALNVMQAFVLTDLKSNPPILRESLVCADSLIQISGLHVDTSNTEGITNHLNNLNDLVRNQSMYLFINRDKAISESRNKNTTQQAKLVYGTLMNSTKLPDMKTLHIASTDALNNHGFEVSEIKSLIDSISPLEGRMEATNRFTNLFPKGEKIAVGVAHNFSHNGGYQLLAYLYAATGNTRRVLQSLDSLKRYNPDYDKLFINSTHVSTYFLLYNHPMAFREFAESYAKKLGLNTHIYLKQILSDAGVTFIDYRIKFFKHGNYNDNLRIIDSSRRRQLFEYARELVQKELKKPDEINYNMALLYKLEGSLVDKVEYQQGLERSNESDSLFQQALFYFRRTSSGFLDEKISIQFQTGFVNTEKRIMPRKHLFLFPDQMKTAETYHQPTWFRFYGDAFFNFMLKNNLFLAYYKNRDDYQLLTSWLIGYFEQYGTQGNRPSLVYPELGLSTFLAVDSLIAKSNFDVDDAWVKMILIRNYFEKGDTTEAYRQVKELKFAEFERFGGGDRDAFHNAKIGVAGELAIRGKRKESLDIITQFSNPKNRIVAYAKLAGICQQHRAFQEVEFYLDSANAEFAHLKNLDGGFRVQLIETLILQGKNESEEKALEYVGSMTGGNRAEGVTRMVWGNAVINKYFKAANTIPPLSSVSDRLIFYDWIIEAENLKPEHYSEEWEHYNKMIHSSIDFIFFENDLISN